MRGRLQILIADRSALVVEALEDLFVEVGNGTALLTAGSLEETLEVARREQPELIVIDPWMGADAEITVRRLLECSPRSAVFVMATTCDEDFQRQMRLAGVAGCYEKDAMPAAARSILDTLKALR